MPSTTLLSNGTSYFASQTVNGCESASRASVLVNLQNTPKPMVNAFMNFCQNATVGDIVVSGQNIQFYADSLAILSLSSNVSLTNGQIIYCTQTINNCESKTAQIEISITNIDATLIMNGMTLSAVQNAATYRWLNYNAGMLAIPGATNQSFNVTANGAYAVEIRINACKDTSDCIIINTIDVADLQSENAPRFFPNPTNGKIFLQQYRNGILIEIFDVTGKLVLKEQNTPHIDVSQLNKGLYFIIFFNNERKLIASEKLIKLD